MTEATSYGPMAAARRFVAGAPILLTLLDLDGRVLEFSPPFVKMYVETTGARRDDLIGPQTC